MVDVWAMGYGLWCGCGLWCGLGVKLGIKGGIDWGIIICIMKNNKIPIMIANISSINIYNCIIKYYALAKRLVEKESFLSVLPVPSYRP